MSALWCWNIQNMAIKPWQVIVSLSGCSSISNGRRGRTYAAVNKPTWLGEVLTITSVSLAPLLTACSWSISKFWDIYSKIVVYKIIIYRSIRKLKFIWFFWSTFHWITYIGKISHTPPYQWIAAAGYTCHMTRYVRLRTALDSSMYVLGRAK